MPKAVIYNMAGDKVGEYELSEAVFGIEPNEAVLHASVKNYLANQRQGPQSALTKGVTTTTATIISAYEILNNRVLVVDKAALQKIEEVFA